MATITTVTQTHVLKAGQKLALPSGAVVKSIGISGDIILSSPCPQVQNKIDNAESLLCYEFLYTYDASDDTHIGDNIELRNLIIGTTLYPLNIDGDSNGFEGEEDLADQLASKFPAGIVTFTGVEVDDGIDILKDVTISVKMTPSIAAQASIYMTMKGFDDGENEENGLYIKPKLVTCPGLS